MSLENVPFRLIPADPALAEPLADYYSRNRSFFEAFDPERCEEFFTPDYQRQILAQQQQLAREQRSYYFYLQPRERPDRIIGLVGLSHVVWGAFYSCFLGYKLDREYLNRGYMTMAVEMLVQYAFEELNLHRIEANVMPRNKASLRVLEKNGFSMEGMSPQYLNIHGVWEDHIHMVKRNDLWRRT